MMSKRLEIRIVVRQLSLILCFVTSALCVFSKEKPEDLDPQETVAWSVLPYGPLAQHRIKKNLQNLQSLYLLAYGLGHYGLGHYGLRHYGPWQYGLGGNFALDYNGVGNFGGYGSIGHGYRYLPRVGPSYGYYGGEYGYKY